MEPLWSPVVATVGNRRQIDGTSKSRKQAKTVACGCDRLPERFHGKEGVDGSSPSEGFRRGPGNRPFLGTCRLSVLKPGWRLGTGFGDRSCSAGTRPPRLFAT